MNPWLIAILAVWSLLIIPAVLVFFFPGDGR